MRRAASSTVCALSSAATPHAQIADVGFVFFRKGLLDDRDLVKSTDLFGVIQKP